MKLTKRQQDIAAATVPTYGGYATREEVKKVKLLTRGHYWDCPEFEEYCSISPSGERNYFEYILYSWASNTKKKEWKKQYRKIARLWALGKKKKALNADRSLYESSLFPPQD